jgi:hypothetical protein
MTISVKPALAQAAAGFLMPVWELHRRVKKQLAGRSINAAKALGSLHNPG